MAAAGNPQVPPAASGVGSPEERAGPSAPRRRVRWIATVEGGNLMAPEHPFLGEADGDVSALHGERVAVVGYGNLGRPAALNLRDNGLEVVVASLRRPPAARAEADGFRVVPVEEAVGGADVVWVALPDELVPDLLSSSAAARPRAGSLVCLSSGYTLAYGLLKLPDDVDATILAPRMIGARLRERFTAGDGFYSFLSVEQDATGRARPRLLALAKAFGTLRRGALELPAAVEAALDLFVEQTVGPTLGAAVLTAFEVGAAAGLPPEALALELYLSGEMAATWASFAEHGFFGGVRLHGHAAAFGGFLRMGDVGTEEMKGRFASVLEDIRSGRFAAAFQDELASGSPTRALIEAMTAGDDPLTKAERRVQDAGST